MQLGVVGDAVGLDVLGDGLIDVALRKLRVAEAGAVADEFVGEASGETPVMMKFQTACSRTEPWPTSMMWPRYASLPPGRGLAKHM